VLEPLRGHRRYNAITALRSLFRFAKRRGLTFADPTRHLSGGRATERILFPMTAEDIQAVQQAAVTPAQRLAIALAAVHAARPAAIRGLTLDDIDLPNRRVTLAGHRQPLGELTHDALLAWLQYRRAIWPSTANRHVLVSRISALGTEPVSPGYLDKHQLRGISLEHIRRDRILHEALATDADPVHLALVFNIDHTNAMAYTNAARSLLSALVEGLVLQRHADHVLRTAPVKPAMKQRREHPCQ
jgi:integrase